MTEQIEYEKDDGIRVTALSAARALAFLGVRAEDGWTAVDIGPPPERPGFYKPGARSWRVRRVAS